VSEHVRERLSPLLDGELPSAERAEVEAHVESCPECAGLLEDLAAVDTLARALPMPAPADGFESFATRVRARIAARPRRRGLPAWSWAVAAALLLAVVTPMTLIRLSHQEPTAQQTAQAPAAQPQQPAPSLPPTTLGDIPLAEGGRQARSDARARALEDKVSLNRRAADRAYETRLEKRKQEGAVATGGAKPEPTADRLSGLGYVGGAPAPAAPPPAPPPAEETGRLGERESGTDAKKAQTLPPATTTLPGGLAAARPQARSSPSVAAATPGPARDRDAAFERAAELQLEADDALDRFLAAPPFKTVEAARKAREAWRTYVGAQPDGPRADVARVRTIEAGMAAWELSREEPDREVVLRDIAQYLARRDSRQGERVRSLRQRLEPR
jgi:hypothetical protein